jgi:hypothetical protein
MLFYISYINSACLLISSENYWLDFTEATLKFTGLI